MMNLLSRLGRARAWIVLQFVLTLVLILAGLAWTRLPDKHVWQVVLILLVPVLLAISMLELQTGTVRKLADDDGRRVKLVWGAVCLLAWIAIGAAVWCLLDWCDNQIPLWSGYFNSKFGSYARAATFTYDHIQHWLTALEWVLRWVVLPVKLIPFGAASAQWGWRLPWRRILRFLFNGRWWLGVVFASLMGVWLPGLLFEKLPAGTVTAQVWGVGLKLFAAYLLAMGCWVLLLGWWATLFVRRKEPPIEDALVPVPVLAGPPGRERSSKAELPTTDNNISE